MICLNCGYCCVYHDVIIIHPDYINQINVVDDINMHTLMHKPSQTVCPHLYKDNGKLLCQIHHKPWYNSTPCANHTQIESGNTECRLGRYVIDNNINKDIIQVFQNQRYRYEKLDG